VAKNRNPNYPNWDTGWVRKANHHHLIEGCKKKTEYENKNGKEPREPFGK